MKRTVNIPAIFLAILVFVATNGVLIFEHICTTSNSHNFSIFSKSGCEMDKPLPPCCAKMGIKKKKDCCANKQFFSKLSVEGFASKKTSLHFTSTNSIYPLFVNNFCLYNKINFENYYIGLPPPDNLLHIRHLLRPTLQDLQVIRC